MTKPHFRFTFAEMILAAIFGGGFVALILVGILTMTGMFH